MRNKMFFVKIEGIDFGDKYKSISFKVKADRVIICDLHKEQAGYGLLMACGCEKKDIRSRCLLEDGSYIYRNFSHLGLGCIGFILDKYRQYIDYICEPKILPSRLLIDEVVDGKRVRICSLDLKKNEDIDGFDTLGNEIVLRSVRSKGNFDYFFKR